jgi:hypothetical protein
MDTYKATYLPALGQKFVVDIEYRVRWVPYVAPTTPEVPYQITVGYHELEDMEQGTVSADDRRGVHRGDQLPDFEPGGTPRR